jgi:hypothetical protein
MKTALHGLDEFTCRFGRSGAKDRPRHSVRLLNITENGKSLRECRLIHLPEKETCRLSVHLIHAHVEWTVTEIGKTAISIF